MTTEEPSRSSFTPTLGRNRALNSSEQSRTWAGKLTGRTLAVLMSVESRPGGYAQESPAGGLDP